ncbi:MAG: hypothetical protein ABIF12_01590 [bacterium]
MNKLIKNVFFTLLTISILSNINASLKRKLNKRNETIFPKKPNRRTEFLKERGNSKIKIDLIKIREKVEKILLDEKKSLRFLDIPEHLLLKILLTLDIKNIIMIVDTHKYFDELTKSNWFLNQYPWENENQKRYFQISSDIVQKKWGKIDLFLDNPETTGTDLISHADYKSPLVLMIENQAPTDLIEKMIKNGANQWSYHFEWDNDQIVQTYPPLATLLINYENYNEKWFYNTLYMLLNYGCYNYFTENYTKNSYLHMIINDKKFNTETKLNIIEAFYEFNINFNQFNAERKTALHLALENGESLEIIDLLICGGCKVYSNMINIANRIYDGSMNSDKYLILQMLYENYKEENDFDLIPEDESSDSGDWASI